MYFNPRINLCFVFFQKFFNNNNKREKTLGSFWCIVQLVVVLCSWNKSKVRARKRGIVSNYSNGFRVGKTGPFIHECSRSSKITFFTNFVCNLYILIVWWSFGKLSVLVTRFNVEYRCSAICLFQTSLSIQIVPTYHSRESSHTSIPIPPSLSFIPWCLKSLPIVMLQMKLQYLLTTKATSNSLPRTAKPGAKDFYFLRWKYSAPKILTQKINMHIFT